MKRKIKILLIISIILCIFIIGFMIKKSYSSFFSKITGISTTKVADPVFSLEHTDKKVVNNANTEVDYYFTVRNYNKEKINEIELKYMLEITPEQDKSIVLSLFKDNEKIDLNNQKTNYFTLDHTNKEEHHYRLNVKYDKTGLINCYDINSNIFIKANAMQIN